MGLLSSLLFRQLTATLLWNTVRLCVAVTAASAVIGTAAAWCTERTDLPGRRLWVVLVVIPVAIPDFVVSFGWVSIFPSLHGFLGATLVMTLAVYPLVYLPVAASFRGSDPGQEEVARSLGLGPLRTFWRVTLAQARTALFGGCLLVSLALLGRVRRLRDSPLPDPHHRDLHQTAGRLQFRRRLWAVARPRASRPDPVDGRRVRPDIGPDQLAPAPRRCGCGLPSGWAGPPRPFRRLLPSRSPGSRGTHRRLGRWLVQSGRTTLPAAASLSSAAWHSAGYSAAAAAVATVAALPVALLSVRHPGRTTMALERSTFLVLALPGIVIALALAYFSEHYVPGLYQHTPLLVLAYAILFFPLALVAVRASVAQAPVGLEEVARALGCNPWTALWRVTLRLVAPGLAAAFCLVFLSTVTELTSTDPHTHRGPDAGHSVLGLHDRPILRRRCSLCRSHGGHRRHPQLPFGALVQPAPGESHPITDMTRLAATDLHKAFGSQSVLSGIDLDVPEGSLTAIWARRAVVRPHCSGSWPGSSVPIGASSRSATGW